MKISLCVSIFSLILGVSCTTEDQSTEALAQPETKEGIKVINGVERSELALTMRLMYDEMKLVRDSLKAGHQISPTHLERYRSIHTDIATEPEKIDETYKAMASLFLNQYEAFENVQEDKTVAFNAMLDGCVSCHQNKCPGPIKAINKLRL